MIIIVPIEAAIFIGALSSVVGLVSDELELSVELLPDDDVSVELPELEEPEVESDEPEAEPEIVPEELPELEPDELELEEFPPSSLGFSTA